MVPTGGAGIGMHVIPVEKAIDMNNEAISLEKISYWLDKYDGKYAASPCSCRKSRKTNDEGCADDPEDWCIAVGDMADYVVETGRAVIITLRKKHLRYSRRLKTMVLFTRLLILTDRTRYLLYVTVMLMSVMHLEHRSYLTHLICHVRHMLPR